MGRAWIRRGAAVVLACGAAAAVVGSTARAVNDDLDIFSSFLYMDGGPPIGTGGDGSVVLFVATYSMNGFEESTASGDFTIVTTHTVTDTAVFPNTDPTDPNTIFVAGHGFLDNDVVRFPSSSNQSNILPAGISQNTNYYVITYDADRFQLATTPGGSAITLLDSGLGTHTFTRTTGKPYVADNDDIFSWEPNQDVVSQFSVSADVEVSSADALAWRTGNSDPAVFSRTGDGRDPAGTRITAIAWQTNADPEFPGPIANIDEIGLPYRELGGSGRLIAYTDTEIGQTVPLVVGAQDHYSFDPSVAFRTKVTNRGSSAPSNLRTIAITDAWVAFGSNADNSQDNGDGNDEIFLFTRSKFLASGGAEGVVNNLGVQQITHTTSGSCWNPAVSINGDVAFVSDANITGANGDGSSEIFIYRRRKDEIVQVTSISPTRYVDNPCWGDSGRRLAFESDADLTGENPDASIEIFVRSGNRLRQVTDGSTGDSWAPSMDPFGGTVAFLTTADLPNVVYGGIPRPEVVTTPWSKRRYRQITQVNDGEFNEAPTATKTRTGRLQVTWTSTSNLDGRNSNFNRRIYRHTAPR